MTPDAENVKAKYAGQIASMGRKYCSRPSIPGCRTFEHHLKIFKQRLRGGKADTAEYSDSNFSSLRISPMAEMCAFIEILITVCLGSIV